MASTGSPAPGGRGVHPNPSLFTATCHAYPPLLLVPQHPALTPVWHCPSPKDLQVGGAALSSLFGSKLRTPSSAHPSSIQKAEQRGGAYTLGFASTPVTLGETVNHSEPQRPHLRSVRISNTISSWLVSLRWNLVQYHTSLAGAPAC